jgi:hypothetical protein
MVDVGTLEVAGFRRLTATGHAATGSADHRRRPAAVRRRAATWRTVSATASGARIWDFAAFLDIGRLVEFARNETVCDPREAGGGEFRRGPRGGGA